MIDISTPHHVFGTMDIIGPWIGLLYLICWAYVMVKEKDRMIIAFSKRPRWNVLAIGLFPPAWLVLVLMAEPLKDDSVI